LLGLENDRTGRIAVVQRRLRPVSNPAIWFIFHSHFPQILISSILRKIILRYAVFGGKLLIMMMMMMMMIIIIIIIIIIITSAVATVSHHTVSVTASARFSVFLGPQWP